MKAFNRNFGWVSGSGSGVFKPPLTDLLIWLEGGLDTSTLNTSKDNLSLHVPSTYGDSYCKWFNGIDDRLDCGTLAGALSDTTDDFVLEFYADLTNALENDVVVNKSQGLTTEGWSVDISGAAADSIGFQIYNGTTSKFIRCTGVVSGWANYKLTRVSDQYTWYINDVPQTPTSDTLSNQAFTYIVSNGTMRLGCRIPAPYIDMRISHFKITLDGAVDTEYNFCSGVSLNEPDLSGSGNHGEYVGDATAMSVTDDEAKPHNIEDGFSPCWTNNTPLTTNYLTLNVPDDQETAGELSVGFWAKINNRSPGGTTTIMHCGTGITDGFQVETDSTNITFKGWHGSAGPISLSVTLSAITGYVPFGWNYWEVNFLSSNHTLYCNGQQVASAFNANAIVMPSAPYTLTAFNYDTSSSLSFQGDLKDITIDTKGVAPILLDDDNILSDNGTVAGVIPAAETSKDVRALSYDNVGIIGAFGGYTHNGAESSLLLNAGATAIGTITYQELVDWINYDQNMLVYSSLDRNYIVVNEILIYDILKEFTLDEWMRLNRGGSLNDTYAPAQDELGAWIYDVNDTLILFPPA